MDSKTVGRLGEQSAASFLCGKGFRIVGKNVRCGHLETDIIAENGEFLVFAEVKTRSEYPNSRHSFGRPGAAVDSAKQQKLIAGARKYFAQHPEFDKLQPRIDVVEVYISPDSDKYKVLKIIHMESAVRRRSTL